MKPFLLLQLRPIDAAADNEMEAFLKYGRLHTDEVLRVRMEKSGIPNINLEDYSAVIVGGGPSNVSDEESTKEAYQKRFEKDLDELLAQIIELDFPYFGSCYGLGALARRAGSEVSKKRFSEEVGYAQIKVIEKDDLLKNVPDTFFAYVGHKEACQFLPKGAALLASSDQCPIHMIRIKNNIYATQFHTELDTLGITKRIQYYRHHGYFPPEEADELIQIMQNVAVSVPMEILQAFVEKYRC
jgi:GMP synthase (glutamine-hydrolysing)